MLTKEQFDFPRFIVVAPESCKSDIPYPYSPFKIGEILTFTHKGNLPFDYNENETPLETWLTDVIEKDDKNSVYAISLCEDFPHIFSPLHWWEHRKLEDFPHFIEFNKELIPTDQCNLEDGSVKVRGEVWYMTNATPHY